MNPSLEARLPLSLRETVPARQAPAVLIPCNGCDRSEKKIPAQGRDDGRGAKVTSMSSRTAQRSQQRHPGPRAARDPGSCLQWHTVQVVARPPLGAGTRRESIPGGSAPAVPAGDGPSPPSAGRAYTLQRLRQVRKKIPAQGRDDGMGAKVNSMSSRTAQRSQQRHPGPRAARDPGSYFCWHTV